MELLSPHNCTGQLFMIIIFLHIHPVGSVSLKNSNTSFPQFSQDSLYECVSPLVIYWIAARDSSYQSFPYLGFLISSLPNCTLYLCYCSFEHISMLKMAKLYLMLLGQDPHFWIMHETLLLSHLHQLQPYSSPTLIHILSENSISLMRCLTYWMYNFK